MDGWSEWGSPAKRLRGARKARGLTQDQLSEVSGVKQSDISKLERGDSLTTSKWPQLARALRVDAYWLTAGEGAPEGSDQAAGFASIAPPSIGHAVHVLAEALMNMDPIGRGMAEGALASIAKAPEQADRAVQMLELLIRTHTQPPAPPPPTPPKQARAKQAVPARRPDGKAALVLKIGGGEKRQLALPLKTVANPFDPAAAPASERRWYEELRAAPKAAR